MVMENLNREQIIRASRLYGREITNQAVSAVDKNDPISAYMYFESRRMYEHADCVEMLFISEEHQRALYV
jgi:hypothetical protein